MTIGSSRGFALILVLWIAVLFAVIAASLVSSGRTESRLARNLIENAKAEALADGAVHRAVLGLLELDPDRAWRPDGSAHLMAFGEGEVRVTIADEDGKVDLNAAPPELLAGLLRQFGVEEDAADALADRIVDFRDEDDEPRPEGAEDPEYFAAGRELGAQDRPFAAESELLHVLGMSRGLYQSMRPFITVFSGAEAVDPLRAPRLVLAAIPGMTDQLIEAFAGAGPDDDPLGEIGDDSLFDLEVYLIPSREVMYTVRAEARTMGGGTFVREAVVEITLEPRQPFRIHAWRRGTLD
jgi:general secretion pathway protein K